jgi:hypothetical protein
MVVTSAEQNFRQASLSPSIVYLKLRIAAHLDIIEIHVEGGFIGCLYDCEGFQVQGKKSYELEGFHLMY